MGEADNNQVKTMAPMKSVSCVCALVYFVLFCLDFSITYTEMTVENDQLCSHLLKKRKLKLHKNEQSGLIVKETRYFDQWSGRYPFECNFIVKADRNEGVIAVIQQLSFREADEDSEEDGDRCLDFVQFKRDDGTESKKYCGRIQAYTAVLDGESSDGGRADFNKQLEVSQNAFYDQAGELEVKIYVKNKYLYPTETIDLEIAFTSYTYCHKYVRNYSSCGTDICIWDGFFHDGTVNCPFNNCLDESGLCGSPTVSKRGLSSKVTVGAIATIFLSFLLFFVCLWLVRRHGLLCWSRDCSGRQPPEPRVEMRPHLPPVRDDEGAAPQPSAPLEAPAEKDLPPPYESLFPDK